MEYYQDIFYNTNNLSISIKTEICNWAKERCFKWYVDELDTNKSFARQEVKMSYEDIMKMLDNKCHFVVIHRRGDEKWKGKEIFNNRWCLDIGFFTIGKNPDYFLWIYCDEKYIDEIIKQFNLEIL